MPNCTKCNDTGKYSDFAVGIGPYPADCQCHKTCSTCNGTGAGESGFAIGIGPYPTDCPTCKGKGKVPKLPGE